MTTHLSPSDHGAGPEQGAAAPEPVVPRSPEPQAAPVRSGRLRWIALGTAAVLSAVLVGAVAGEVVRHTSGEVSVDISTSAAPPLAAASPSPAFGAKPDGDHFGSLADLLLPVPDNYSLGPDDAGEGADTVLSSSQYQRIAQAGFKGLSATERSALDKALDLENVRGFALRSYRSEYSEGTDGAEQVEIDLLQENQQHASAGAAWLKQFTTDTNIYRAGPSIAGYPSAHCYLEPGVPGDKLDHMTCAAAIGDLVVTMQVDGVAPLDTATAGAMLKAQLDRLAIPAAQL